MRFTKEMMAELRNAFGDRTFDAVRVLNKFHHEIEAEKPLVPSVALETETDVKEMTIPEYIAYMNYDPGRCTDILEAFQRHPDTQYLMAVGHRLAANVIECIHVLRPKESVTNAS